MDSKELAKTELEELKKELSKTNKRAKELKEEIKDKEKYIGVKKKKEVIKQ